MEDKNIGSIDINKAEKFMKSHKKEINNLFLIYQMIEMMFFMNLYWPYIPEDNRKEHLDGLNKKSNSKTLGKMKKRYLEIFPEDNYNLISILEIVIPQRNTFMHSFWMFLALWEDKKKTVTTIGEEILESYQENANKLFDKVLKLSN